MVLFCLTVSNALIITLKTEIDKETVEILQVCCWALSRIKIDKNFIKDLNKCVDEILDNDMYKRSEIDKFIKINSNNFFVLPNAFN